MALALALSTRRAGFSFVLGLDNEGHGIGHGFDLAQLLLPRDAMLARYILSSCRVRPSVCHKSEFYKDD